MKFKVGDRVRCINDGDWGRNLSGKFGTIKVKHDKSSWGVEFDKYIYGHSCEGKAKDGHGWNCEERMLELVEEKTNPMKVNNECVVIYRKDREVIALDKLTGKKAVARCHPDDEFNFKFGATLAFDRLTNRALECKKVKFNLRLGIWCENEKQFDELMCHLDKIGCRWVCGRERPTEWKPLNLNNGVRIYIKTDKTISFSRIKAAVYDIYTAIDFDNVDFSDLKPLYNGKVVCVDNKNNTDTWTIGKIYQFTGGLIVSDAGVVFPGKYTPVYSFKEWSDWTSAKFIEVVE